MWLCELVLSSLGHFPALERGRKGKGKAGNWQSPVAFTPRGSGSSDLLSDGHWPGTLVLSENLSKQPCALFGPLYFTMSNPFSSKALRLSCYISDCRAGLWDYCSHWKEEAEGGRGYNKQPSLDHTANHFQSWVSRTQVPW